MQFEYQQGCNFNLYNNNAINNILYKPVLLSLAFSCLFYRIFVDEAWTI